LLNHTRVIEELQSHLQPELKAQNPTPWNILLFFFHLTIDNSGHCCLK